MTQAEIDRKYQLQLAAAKADLDELLASDGDSFVAAFARDVSFHETALPRCVAAARVGFLTMLCERIEKRNLTARSTAGI